MVEMIGHGVYSIPEAARLISVPARRVRYWFLGQVDRPEPLRRGDYAGVPTARDLLSFLDLIDALVVGRFREDGVSLQRLRRVHDRLLEEFGRHPFSQKTLFTDRERRRFFIHSATEEGDERLEELLSGQHAFPTVLLPYLDRVDYGPSDFAQRWHVRPGIVIDPERQFGKPIVEQAGIPTAVLAAAFSGNEGDAEVVADWYNVPPEEVMLAVEYEERVGANAA